MCLLTLLRCKALAGSTIFFMLPFSVAFLLITYLFYPETRGHTLEQIAFIFDGEDADLVTPKGKDHNLVEQKSA